VQQVPLEQAEEYLNDKPDMEVGSGTSEDNYESETENPRDGALSRSEATPNSPITGRPFDIYKERLRNFLHPTLGEAEAQGGLQPDGLRYIPIEISPNRSEHKVNNVATLLADVLGLKSAHAEREHSSSTDRKNIKVILLIN